MTQPHCWLADLCGFNHSWIILTKTAHLDEALVELRKIWKPEDGVIRDLKYLGVSANPIILDPKTLTMEKLRESMKKRLAEHLAILKREGEPNVGLRGQIEEIEHWMEVINAT